MIKHDGKVFAFEIREKIYELYQIKTVRKHKIYIDKFGQYYASWNDFWHVFNNLEESIDNHWSIYKPLYIHESHKRFVAKKLTKFKRELKPEDWDIYLNAWNQWENLLYEDEKTLEIDITEISISDKLNYLGFHYSKFVSTKDLIQHVEREYFKHSKFSPAYNANWILIDTYSGKKLVNMENKTLEDSGILPGTILLAKLI